MHEQLGTMQKRIEVSKCEATKKQETLIKAKKRVTEEKNEHLNSMGDVEYLWGRFFCTPHLSILGGEIPYKVTTIEWFNIGLKQWIVFII